MKSLKLKNLFHLSSILVFSLFWSCDENSIRFEEAQPKGISSDPSIRKEFQGIYFCEEDSVYLLVGSNRISLQFENEISLESFPELNGSLSVGDDSSGKFKVRIRSESSGQGSDSTILETSFEEVLLDLTSGHEARYYKGYYFLNALSEGAGFKVSYLQKTRDGLSLFRIESDSVLHSMEGASFISKKTVKGEDEEETWSLNPSRRELRKLIRRGLFSGEIHFKRLSRLEKTVSRP
jgi:hypothetical protein